MNNKYQNGKIYRLVSKHSPIPYYGSTVQRLSKRFYEHKERFRNNSKINYSSFKIIELGDYKIELVENYPCNSRRELELREAYWIKNNLCVNKILSARSEEERTEYKKNWYVKNKQTIRAKAKKNYEANKDIINQKNKKWYEENRDDQLIKKKEKRAKNKHEYNKIIQCECGGTYMKRGKNRHLKTKKHQSYKNGE